MDVTAAIRDCLLGWLESRLAGPAVAWLEERSEALRAGAPERQFFFAFSGAVRHTGKAPLALGADEVAAAARLRPGWQPGGWTCDQAARTLLALSLPHDDADALILTLDRTFAAADIGELVALYQALPLLPHPAAHVPRCAEGLRTNMTTVFRAVVHRNPYPSEHLDEPAWNQMVLKALFVGVALDPIHGLDARANPALMRMLCDYAHERWAARRAVSPELWRCVGPHADDAALADLRRVLAEGGAKEQQAAVLALRACPRPEAARLVEEHGVPVELAWSDLA